MSGRAYLAWNMLVVAEYEDQRREQCQFQHNMRVHFGYQLENISDRKFVKLYRLSKEAFEDLCSLLSVTGLKSTQRVTLQTKVLCSLLFFANGDYQRIVGEANHLSQEVISVYIQEVTKALNHPTVLKKYIKFPTTRQERNVIMERFFNKYGFPGTIGCIDGSHFKIFTPNKEEEHLYFCRKHYHSLNVQVVCDADCRILSLNPKFGGATHDAFIWQNSNINNYMQHLHRSNEIVWLLGDSGYPQRPWLMTPYPDPVPYSVEEEFNKAHVSTRVVIENTFGRLKNRWRCLSKDRTLHYNPEKCAQIITACCVLHNIALKYNVPDPDDSLLPRGILMIVTLALVAAASAENATETREAKSTFSVFDPSVDPNDLSCDPDGQIFLLLPHFYDCNKFFMCAHGQEVEFRCAGNTYFVFHDQLCQYPHLARCVLRSLPDIEGSGDKVNDNMIGYFVDEMERQPVDTVASVRPISPLISKFNGIINCNRADDAARHVPYRGDCQRYWRCVAGVPQVAYCSDGLFFNPATQQCDFEANSKCNADLPVDELQNEFIVYKK